MITVVAMSCAILSPAIPAALAIVFSGRLSVPGLVSFAFASRGLTWTTCAVACAGVGEGAVPGVGDGDTVGGAVGVTDGFGVGVWLAPQAVAINDPRRIAARCTNTR